MPAQIIDIHSRGFAMGDVVQDVVRGLSRPAGQKSLPTVLLYDEQGLRLYDKITTDAAEYYLFHAEEQILRNNADAIVRAMHHDSAGNLGDEVVLELGAGALRKTSHILLALSRFYDSAGTSTPITYYALDLERRELERTLAEIKASEIGETLRGKVDIKGICGTYDDGLKFLEDGGLDTQRISEKLSTSMDRFRFTRPDSSPISSVSSFCETLTDTEYSSHMSTPDRAQPPLHIIFLGSSLGNFSRPDAAEFLRSLPIRPGSADTLLIGLDHDNDKTLVENAYNDHKGCTRQFILNGLKAAGRTLGDDSMFDHDNWEYVNSYNPVERRHQAFYKSKRAHTIKNPSNHKVFTFLENELVKIEESLKYSEEDAFSLFTDGNFRPLLRWTDVASQYSLWLLERPTFIFPLLSSPMACSKRGELVPKHSQSSTPFGVPSRQEWENLWAAWDCVTTDMIPKPMLFQKPIKLRHICLFYLGHIPTFLDIHLSKLLGEPHTEPEEYKYIFERGIDPYVDDPSKCHPHSEVPKEESDWPTLTAILRFQARVRARLMALYDDIDAGRKTLTRRIGRVLFMTLEHEAMHAETLLYMLLQSAGSGTLPPPGFQVPLWESLAAIWKSREMPPTRTVTLGSDVVILGHNDNEDDDFEDACVNVKDHEFGWDNENPQRRVKVDDFKIDWRPVTNKEFYNFYIGADKKKIPFPASWIDDNGTILIRTLYGPVSMDIAEDWPVLTCYNNLSAYAKFNGGRLPTEAELRLFYNKFDCGYKGGANMGFRNWHPVPATTGGGRNLKGHNGGVWEWTSTVHEEVDGFVPSKLYPGYSKDFFEGRLYQVVIGHSYATIPRIAERRSFRNWYQRNYPYAWIGGRVAYDMDQ